MVTFTDLGSLSLDLATGLTIFDSRDAIGALQLMAASVSCLSPENNLNTKRFGRSKQSKNGKSSELWPSGQFWKCPSSTKACHGIRMWVLNSWDGCSDVLIFPQPVRGCLAVQEP